MELSGPKIRKVFMFCEKKLSTPKTKKNSEWERKKISKKKTKKKTKQTLKKFLSSSDMELSGLTLCFRYIGSLFGPFRNDPSLCSPMGTEMVLDRYVTFPVSIWNDTIR